MLKQKAVLEVKVNERVYSLECLPESPLGELYDALCQLRAYVIQRMVDEQKASEQKSDVVVAPEEPKVE